MKSSFVNLKIYYAPGQEVIKIISEVKKPGQYESLWNGKDRNMQSVASGVYIYCLQTDGFTVPEVKNLFFKNSESSEGFL